MAEAAARHQGTMVSKAARRSTGQGVMVPYRITLGRGIWSRRYSHIGDWAAIDGSAQNHIGQLAELMSVIATMLHSFSEKMY